MIEPRIMHVTLATIGVLILALVPTLWHWSIAKKAQKDSSLVAAWCGLSVGAGLAIGGMVRPSVIQAAFTPFRFDFTLWVLFTAALVTTFTLYRVASRAFGVAEACMAPGKQGPITTKLVVGAVLFGIGWGATGLCPGPLIVLVAAQPTNIDGLLCLLGVVLGMLIAESKEMSDLLMACDRGKVCSISCKQPLAAITPPTSSPALEESSAPPQPPLSPLTPSTPEDLKAALDAGALIVELRAATPSEGIDGTFRTIKGAVSVLWDSKTETINLGALPKDKTAPLILVCRTGNRAGKAAAFLITSGYTRVFNGGGPLGPIGSWGVLITHCGELTYSFRGGLRQLFDGAAPSGGGSSTYTYILTDDATKEAIIIDPVLEQVERDVEAIREMGCTLVYALNTHCHADHITGTGRLKELAPHVRSCIARASGAKADILLDDMQKVSWAGGTRSLMVLATPGHTNGCVCYHETEAGLVFTGDTLLIGGCGRTDFQEGDAAKLYDSVHGRLFMLPAETLVLPAHDYQGRSFTTIGAQRATNPRLTKTKAQFVELMVDLRLRYPAKLDVAVPANLQCGAYGA